MTTMVDKSNRSKSNRSKSNRSKSNRTKNDSGHVAKASCSHPANKNYTGFYKGIMDHDHLWIACCNCGSIVRDAPAFSRDEAEWKHEHQAES